MSKPSIEIRVSEVETASIRASNAIAAMQTEFTSLNRKIDALGGHMASMTKRMHSIDARMEFMGARVDSMGEQMGSMVKRMDSMDARMDSMDGRIEDLAKTQDEGFADLRASIGAVADETAGLKAWREEITPKITKVVAHAENRGIHRH